jgi:hypothetical protein
LDVDHIEAEAVFLYDAINAPISGTADGASRILAGATITHGHEKLYHDTLEEPRRCALNSA